MIILAPKEPRSLFCPDALVALRTGRPKSRATAYRPVWEIPSQAVKQNAFDIASVVGLLTNNYSLPTKIQLLTMSFALCRPGGSGGVAAPVPIPNTAVKRPSADGTSS